MPPRKSRLKVNDLPPGGTAASAAETEARRFLDETFGGDRGAQEWDHKRRELVAQFMDSAIARDEEILRRLGFGPGNDSAARTTTNVILTKSMKRDELGKLESTLDPSTFQTLQESILTRRLKLGEVSSDHQEHGGVHRLSLWKCLSTLLLGDEEGWKNILEVTVAHMWANQEQYDQVVRAAWATNQHTASNKSYAEYLSSLWNGRTFPLFVVLDAAAAALNIDIRVWSYRSTKEKYLFVFEAPSDPLRTLHLVRQRNQQAGDYAYYRPLALPEAHELDDDLPSQSISQALLDEEVREKKIMLRLPGRQFESIEELLQMGFIVIEDEPGYTMRLYNTGPRRYTVRRHRGHRLVDEPNSRFPIDFNLDLDDSDPNILVPDSPRLQSPRRRDIPVHDREAISGFGDGDEHVADVALPDFDLSLRNVCGRLINTLDDFRKHLREGEDEEPAQSPGHEGIEPGGNFVRYLLGSNIVDANNRLDTLFAEAFQHLRLYEQHDIAALFVGTTKAGKTTTINTISRNNLVSEEQWQRLCQRTPYDDSGPEFGGSTEDDLHYLDYNIEGDDILPVSNIADTTTRFAQVIVCSDGEVSFSLEMWPFGELLPQLERINNIFQMFKYPDDNPDDDDQENAPSDNESLDGVSTSIADRLEDWMKNDPGIAISMGVLLSLLSPNDRAISKSELEGLEELVLPPLKLETLRNLSASSTVRFRRATLAESVEALSNEYLRMTVNPESLHGLIKKAIIRLPMVRNLRLIDVPGLQELDPYGYAVALEGLAHVYGRYESLVLVMSNNGASADVTKALQGAWAKHLQGRVLDGAVQIIPFHPLDKVEKLQTVEQQTRNKGPGLVMRAIARKTGEQLAYVRTIFETDRSVGIASPALKLDPQEISRRLNLLMAAIKPLTANVRLQNPDRDVKHVSDLVQMLSEFTASRWRSETEALYKSVIRELSTVVRILHSFSQIDSPATIQSILMEIKRRAAKYGERSMMTAISNQIKAPLERPWNSRAIRDEIAAIVEACGDRRRMQDPETLLPLRNRYLAKGSKTLGRHLREDPAAPHGPSELADYCVRPLLGLLITKLVDLGFAPLEQETAQILQGLTRFVESHFTVDIAVEDPQQLHIAQSILKDERDRLLHQLRRKRSKVLKEKRASACAGLRQVLESAMNDVLGPMFMSARALKAARGMTVNVRRLDDVERMTKQCADEISRAVAKEAQKLVEDTAQAVEKGLLKQFRVFTNRFKSMQPEDVERKLRGESLGKLKQKTSVSCKMLLEVWDSYVEHFYDGVQPPLILDGAVSEDETPTAADIQKHEELVAVYRQLAQNAPLA